MIIETIRLHNFLSHEDSTVEFADAPLWLICGENGAGKSALFDAVEYALYGEHRGGNQNVGLLIKHGAQRATVEVTIQLDGQRYRLRRHLDSRRGNSSGTVEQWQPASEDWRQLYVGEGVRGAWEWLKPHIPSHDLYRSAIFLRQGHTAHFLRGNSTDRVKRFAGLVDLRRYTALARLASARSDDAKRRCNLAEGSLAELGDVSEGALATCRQELERAEIKLSEARQRVATAIAVMRGAERWAAFQNARAQRERDRAELLALLAEADAIRANAQRVEEWDRVAVDLHRYWDARERAGRHRAKVRQAQDAAAQKEAACLAKRGDLIRLQNRQREMRDVRLPAARRQADQVRARLSNLGLEARVAAARASLAVAEEAVARLDGKDRVLAEYRTREAALPRLEALVLSRATLDRSEKELVTSREALRTAEDWAAKALERAATAQADLERCQEEARAALGRMQELDQTLARLEGRIESHARLGGAESECPVCAQPLDATAHAHVREVLQEERARQASLQEELATAREAHASAQLAADEASKAARKSQMVATKAESAVVDAGARLGEAESFHEQARCALIESGKVVAVQHPTYAGHVDDADATWLTAETERISRALEIAKREAADLSTAEIERLSASASLQTLRRQRASTAEPIGDTASSEDLQALVTLAEEEARELDQGVRTLELEDEEIQRGIVAHTSAIAILDSKIEEEVRRADEEAAAATDVEAIADRLANGLGETWAPVLTTREAYESARQEVDDRRENARRRSALEQAHGQLLVVEGQLAHICAELEEIPPDHRIEVAAASASEEEARAAEQRAGTDRMNIERDLRDLEDRRTRAANLQAEVASATQAVATFAELAAILKEGGALQTDIAEREQARIALEVNSVLERLGDPLRVSLGAARRQRGEGIQDVLFADTSDPHGGTRYFEFLSGGEQFRVALALALAVHRRVARTAVGTIIVDEGFGALDSDRRDALTRQMTDMSQGILSLGLAKNIIICSHSTEVQNHFPYRWLVHKRGGTATVERTETVE